MVPRARFPPQDAEVVHRTHVRFRRRASVWDLFSPVARAARRDQGFSVVEVMIAVAVFAVVGAFTSQLLGAGFRGVLLGKRRAVATQEANRVIEIARSLSYDAIGLIESDPTIATDSAIETHASKRSFLSGTKWEPIIWATNPTGHPFSPHIQAIQRGATSLTDHIYVTGVDSNGDGEIDLKRVVVRVAWGESGTSGPRNEVRTQTLVNESGVVGAGPGASGGTDTSGLTPLRATTLATGGALKITSGLLGLSNPLSVTLPTTTGISTFRAVSDATCAATSATLQALDIVDLKGSSVTAEADDDARTAKPSDPPAETSAGNISIGANAVGNILGASIASPVSCDATAIPLPSEVGTGSALGANLNAQTTVTALGGLLNWLLTIADVQTLPVGQTITHESVAGQREVAAQATGSVGLVQVLKIPSIFSNGLVQVDGLSFGASVRGAAGTPSAAPTVTTPNFTVRVFDNGNKLGASCTGITGAGISASRSGSYCNVTVNTAANGYIGGNITVSHSFTELVGVDIVNLIYTITIDLLPPAKSPVDGVVGANGERRWSAEHTPIAVSATLDSNVLGVSIIDSDVDLNLGSVKSTACAEATCI